MYYANEKHSQLDIRDQVSSTLTDLATLQFLIVGQIEHVHNELGNRLLSDPEENILSVLDQEQPVSLQSLARQIERGREHDTVLADSSSLPTRHDQTSIERTTAASTIYSRLTSAGMLCKE